MKKFKSEISDSSSSVEEKDDKYVPGVGKIGPREIVIKSLTTLLLGDCMERVDNGEVTFQEAANACGQVAYLLRLEDAKRKVTP